MLEVIETLLILRERDRTILETRAELVGLNAERADAEARVAATQRALDEAREKAVQFERQRKQLELEIAAKEEEKGRYAHQQLQTKDNEVYQTFAREIVHCAEIIDQLEERQLEVMLAADDQSAVVSQSKAALENANRDKAAAWSAIDEREANLRSRLEGTKADRVKISAGLDHTVISRYERLLARKGTQAMVGIEHGVCGACHMRLPPQVIVDCKHGETVNDCPHCGVILFYTADMVTTPTEVE